MEEHIEEVIKRLIDSGFQPRVVEDMKQHYREKHRVKPYSLSEVRTGFEGQYFGAVMMFKKGGALLLEYDASRKRYNAEFRLITSDRSQLPEEDVSPALGDLSTDRKYYSYRPKVIDVKKVSDLLTLLEKIKLLQVKARDVK